MKKETYDITGMSCAACSARIEKGISGMEGMQQCSVNLLKNSMTVSYDEAELDSGKIIHQVEDIGYGASLHQTQGSKTTGASGRGKNGATDAAAAAAKQMKQRLIVSLVFTIPLFYISMGHMAGWPLPPWLLGARNHMIFAFTQFLLVLPVLIAGGHYFKNGLRNLWHRSPNMDSLIALGSGAAFVYGIYAIYKIAWGFSIEDMDMVETFGMNLYFESSAMILTLITVGKMLEARSKGKTTDALKSLMKLAPKTAVLLQDGQEVTVSIEEVQAGDIFVVRPGENIPVDGIVLEGISAVNEAALTGESIPADKNPGDQVSAATVNQSGFLKCEASRVGEDTTLSQIIRMVSDAAATKAPIAKIADKVSGVFVPAVIGIAAVTIVIWLLCGQSIGYALARGISVLVISCPCALGLATPVAIMVGNGMGAKNGILFKTAVSLEEAGKVNTVVLDKTGTITRGEPKVTDLIMAEGVSEAELLETAYALEARSEHPLAGAVVAMAEEKKLKVCDVQDFMILPGNGLTAIDNGDQLIGGSLTFLNDRIGVPDDVKTVAQRLAEEGKTPLLFLQEGVFAGIIAVADTIKEDSPKAIAELRNMGIRVVMLTGDNERTAKAIGALAGVDDVIAGVLPDGKESVIRDLKKYGKVAMVGDGINDAPALTRADIGIAIGAGTDIAIDAADVVLMKSKLDDVPAAIRLSRATLRNIHENLFWAFIYNIIGIPLAAGIWIPVFGWQLNPMFGAAAMSLSSFCVVTNALRLNFFGMYDAKKDKKIKNQVTLQTVNAKSQMQNKSKEKENHAMEKTMEIKGMMCGHCEATVKKALEALPQVEEAIVSHEKGTAVVKLNAEIADETLKKTVEDKDYQVVSVK